MASFTLGLWSEARCKGCGSEADIDRLMREGARKVGRVPTDGGKGVRIEVELLGGCAMCGGGRFFVTVGFG